MFELKSLPRDPQTRLYLPLVTDKATYHPIQPGGKLGIIRWTEHDKLATTLGLNKSFKQIVDHFDEMAALLTADTKLVNIRQEAILLNHSAKRAIVEKSKVRFQQALYLATIFYIREGDNHLTWDYEQASEYLDDWAKWGLDPEEVFFFGLLTIDGFKQVYEKVMAEVQKETGDKLGSIGLKTENMPT